MQKDEEFVIECIKWFIDHTKSPETKKLLMIYANSLAEYLVKNEPIDYSKHYASVIRETIKSCSEYPIIENIEELLNQCNDATNQEFLRIRTGSYTSIGGNESCIYFRVSSKNFNWFPLIYEVTYSNRKKYDNITICKDEQSLGSQELYSHKGEKFESFPIKEFIELSGNPIIEQLKIS